MFFVSKRYCFFQGSIRRAQSEVVMPKETAIMFLVIFKQQQLDDDYSQTETLT
jgi:hypothetical protein